MKRPSLALVSTPALFLAFAVMPVMSAPFTSVGSGNWDAAANWNPATGVPDTLMFDSAIIAGHDIAYNGVGMSFPGGNLVVADGNSITLNGGSLSQIWAPAAAPLFGTAIAVGISGPVSGVGTLNINGGGNFNSGTANALAVGVTVAALNTGTTGIGTVNINEGTLEMGPVSANTALGGLGLAIGVDPGAVGVINVGTAAGSADSGVLSLESVNAALSAGTRLNGASGGTGTVNVKAGGAYRFGTGVQGFGSGVGGLGNLNVSGGSITGTGIPAAGATPAVPAGDMLFGSGTGTGNFGITSGSVNTAGDIVFGTGAGSTGNLTMSGGEITGLGIWVAEGGTGTANISGGTLAATGDLWIAQGGTGTMTVSGTGAVGAQHVVLGKDSGTGTLNISGGTVASANYMNVGEGGGVGIVNQTGGQVSYNQWMAIGLGGGADGSKYAISGGLLKSTAGIEVGADREATMLISGTGRVETGGLVVGNRAGGNGKLTMTGGTVVDAGDFTVGGAQGAATGLADVSGGTITSARLRVGASGGTGTLNFSGGSLNGGELVVASNRGLGGNEDMGGSKGTINITSGTVNTAGWGEVGRGTGSAGTLNISGSNSQWVHAGGDVQVGLNGGTGSINITNGGRATSNWWINVARGADSTGRILVEGAGSTLTTTDGRIVVGEDGIGTMDVLAGGVVNHNSGDRFMVGKNTTGNGTVTVSGIGSAINKNGGEVRIASDDDGADNSNGVLNVTEGGTFTHKSNSAFLVGVNGTGTVNVSKGGVLTRDMIGSNAGDVLLGSGTNGKGYLNVTEGGKVNNNWWTVISDSDSGTAKVTVDGAGSQLNIAATDQRLVVGRYGNGSMVVSNGGQVNATTGEMHVGMWGSATGDLKIQSGGSINGGTNNSNPDPGARGGMRLIVGTDGGTTGTMSISGGSATFASASIGNNGRATVNQTGGTMNVNQWTEIGQERDNGTHTPVYNISDGVLNTQSLGIGSRRNGAMNISGGVVNVGTNGTVTTNYWGGMNIGLYGPTEDSGSHGNGRLTMSGGTLNAWEEINVAHQSGTVGVFNLSGGTVNINVLDRRINIGKRGDGTMTITGGSIGTFTGFNVGAEPANAGNPATKGVLNVNLDDPAASVGGGDLYLGYGNRPTSGQTVGTVNITQGTLRTDSTTQIGRGGAVDGATQGGKGVVNITGADAKWDHMGGQADIQVGFQGGNGSINITDGGTMNHNWWINLGRNEGVAGSIGAIKVEGAGSTLNVISTGDAQVNIGEDGTGVLNVFDGGKVALGPTNSFYLARNAGSQGTVNLVSGGMLQTPSIIVGGGTALLNVDGGSVIAVANQSNFFQGVTPANSQIGPDGITINTNGFTVGVANSLDGDGGIIKTGAGTLNLTANQLLVGTSEVQGGTLNLTGISLAGSVITKDGGTLSGVGTISGDLSSEGGTVMPGGNGTAGDLTVLGNVTLDPTATLRIDLSDEAAGGFDRIVNTGVFSANGATLTGTFTDTDYVFGVTKYKFVTGPTDATTFANVTPVGMDDILSYGLPMNSKQVIIDGRKFVLESGSLSLIVIPEPSSLLLTAGVALLGLRRRRR